MLFALISKQRARPVRIPSGHMPLAHWQEALPGVFDKGPWNGWTLGGPSPIKRKYKEGKPCLVWRSTHVVLWAPSPWCLSFASWHKTCFSSVRASFPLGFRSEYMKGSRRENNGIQGRRSYIHTGQGASCPSWIKKVNEFYPKKRRRPKPWHAGLQWR